jgi:Flp pilus assembly protein TadG
MRKLLLRFCRDDAGVSAVEFALIATFILVPLMLGGSELGYRVWSKQQLDDAAQAGMDYAIVKQCSSATVCGFDAAGVQNAVQTATKFGTNVTVAPAAGCGANYFCYGCPSGSNVTLSGTTSTICGDGGNSGTYAALTATYTYTPLFQACGDFLPSGLCSSAPITWTVTSVARVY